MTGNQAWLILEELVKGNETAETALLLARVQAQTCPNIWCDDCQEDD